LGPQALADGEKKNNSPIQLFNNSGSNSTSGQSSGRWAGADGEEKTKTLYYLFLCFYFIAASILRRSLASEEESGVPL
jgi:hypothetical protein